MYSVEVIVAMNNRAEAEYQAQTKTKRLGIDPMDLTLTHREALALLMGLNLLQEKTDHGLHREIISLREQTFAVLREWEQGA